MLDDGRLIIICGMAHSGTTAIAYLLQQHPDVILCVNGLQSSLLENDWLLNSQEEPIQRMLDKLPGKRIALKRPWISVWNRDWLLKSMPGAKYVYCYKDKQVTLASWRRSDSFVSDKLRNSDERTMSDYYDFCWNNSLELAKVASVYKVHNSDLLTNPGGKIADLTSWLGLSEYHFDLSLISSKINIKQIVASSV